MLSRVQLAAEGFLLMAFAALLTRFVPFARWRAWLDLAPVGGNPANAAAALTVASSVRKLAARFPRLFICLPQAMAAQWMLRRRGIASEIRFGARPDAAGIGADLHAWLFVGDTCLTGQSAGVPYSPLG